MITSEYNLDEVQIRLLNGDGASWIKKPVDKETIFQLDPFHRNKSIRENLSHKKAIRDVMELLKSEQIEETFAYLTMYKDSLSEDTEIEKAESLISYFRANKEGLVPYHKRVLSMPKSPEGIVYKNMGTMENHIWSIIARRMKHNHSSWSIKGDILQAGQVKEKIGKGYRYPVIGRMLGLDTEIRGDRRKLLYMAGY